mgnify:CR=1 FL=1
MNNDNEANDANDNGDELHVDLPETERQELLRLRREMAHEIMRLRQERARLLWERERERWLLHQVRLLQEQQLRIQDNDNAQRVRVARRQLPPQRQAFEAHILEQQQAELVEEDQEEDADAVSSSMVEPNP